MPEGKFLLSVPIDASQVQGAQPGEKIQVVARDGRGALQTAAVELDAKGQAVATLAFPEQPGDLQLALGPESMPADQVHGLRTITASVPARRWKEGAEIKAEPLLITQFFWDWWLRLCRRFTLTGQVLCANGSPAAGALVCAYDVDFWWWWSSRQQVGCALTDANGAFSIDFIWCCGFLPLWWWEQRLWRLEPPLVDRIQRALSLDPSLRLPVPTPRPDLSFFTALAGTGAGPVRPMFPTLPTLPTFNELSKAVPSGLSLAVPPRPSIPVLKDRIDPTLLSSLRERLASKLAKVPELDALRLWPWWPWDPWFDCSPDILFRVTQGPLQSTVILDEGPWDVRWDIPTHLNVTLRANDRAICLQPDSPHPEGNCVILSNVCNVPVEQIAGNLGAPPSTPAQLGYRGPGESDNPFGEGILIDGWFGDLAGVDYYEFEWSTAGSPMQAMPDGAVSGFYRRFFGPSLTDPTDTAPFHDAYFPLQAKNSSGGVRHVIESLQHFEATHAPGTWGSGRPRQWATDNFFLLIPWSTQDSTFADGTYTLQLIGWDADDPDGVTNRRVVLQCDPADAGHPGTVPNQLILTLDNRHVASGTSSTSSPAQACGDGTVHLCTQEPNTGFSAVTILHLDGSSTPVTACGNVPINSQDRLRIDFVAEDPDGHLSHFTLGATYDSNLVRYLICPASAASQCPGLSGADLLHTVPGATLTPAGAGTIGPTQYSEALAQGVAASPLWHGGTFQLTLNASQVFPETCCYQLELRAYKRTVVSCSSVHANQSEYSFMVVVP